VKVRALRGATTCAEDTVEEIDRQTQDLVRQMLAQNDVDHDDLVSILFTATDDLRSQFPATSARGLGLGDVPLICARELDVRGGMPRTIRVLMHLYTDRSRTELHHVYLGEAKSLRDDLPE
jgi:chorismate mutase